MKNKIVEVYLDSIIKEGCQDSEHRKTEYQRSEHLATEHWTTKHCRTDFRTTECRKTGHWMTERPKPNIQIYPTLKG